ncbi:ABC transporter G family member 23 [Folsomia candida]|uniref:ABC transporter G family member 23 n=1 Tax=Folsomia candida TaxID=158441 RepID=A0A226F2S5_FOLCA|nr:ABC transporter G family member 23 [Folsomia candida]
MIHNPKLLVLDEPCVGLDPVLRQRIWKYLHEICRDHGTSIIISTHYIEETKFCQKVGFMRGGRLLAEDTRVAAGNGSGTRYPHTRTILAGTRYLRVPRATRTAARVYSERVFSEATEAYGSLKYFSRPENAEKLLFLKHNVPALKYE